MPIKSKRVYRINGTVIDQASRIGIAGLRVEAWDKDLIVNDLVGSTITDEQGKFRIQFTEAYLKELFLDRKPDLFFKIFHDEELIRTTEDEVLWNVPSQKIQITIEVNMLATPQTQPNDGATKTFSVNGQVRYADGTPFVGGSVHAFDKEMRSENQLGQTIPDKDGNYQIQYSAKQLSRPDKTNADLIVRVLSQNGETLAASPIIYGALAVETVNLTVQAKESAMPSAYDELVSRITPVMQGVPASDLTDKDIQFIQGAAQVDPAQV